MRGKNVWYLKNDFTIQRNMIVKYGEAQML